MSPILVVEQDASYAEQIAEALRSAGLVVDILSKAENVLSYTANQRPSLVLASANFPDAKQILEHFARHQGGPGAVVMLPVNLVGEVSARDYRADALLTKPFSSEDLLALIERFQSGGALPPEALAPDTQQLTSAEIFGDVLAEVEAEIKVKKTFPRRRKADDLERRLEETLSGVLDMGIGRRRKEVGALASLPDPATTAAPPHPAPPVSHPAPEARQRAAALYTEDEVDQLLDKTLSSLQLPTRPKSRSAPAVSQTEKPSSTISSDLPGFEPLEPAQSSTLGLQPPSGEPQQPPQLNIPDDSSLEPPSFEASAPLSEAATTGDAIPTSPNLPTPSAYTSAPSTPSQPLTPEDLAPTETFRTQKLPLLAESESRPDGIPFGEYSLMNRIAVGGMAEVWQARRRGVEGFQKTVAIKKILSHLTDSSDFVTMFIDEAKLAAQLNHNNIIQIYDLGKVDADFFIAMEFVEGKDLRTILRSGHEQQQPLPLGLALLIAARIARALDYAHRKRDFDNRALGLVHRDVSPQNVLISFEGEIKLCDFGIVKAVAKASTTQMGALKGKLQYMSPEQAWGKSVDSRSDTFSLGAVLFEMLTGTKLFSAESEVGVLDAVRDCLVAPPSTLIPSIPPEVDAIVLRALAKRPEDRYPTAGEMGQEIDNYLQGRQGANEADLSHYMQLLFDEEASAAIELAKHLPANAQGQLDEAPDPLADLIAPTPSFDKPESPAIDFGFSQTSEESLAETGEEDGSATFFPPTPAAREVLPPPDFALPPSETASTAAGDTASEARVDTTSPGPATPDSAVASDPASSAPEPDVVDPDSAKDLAEPPKSTRSLGRWIAVIALLLILAAIAYLFLNRGPATSPQDAPPVLPEAVQSQPTAPSSADHQSSPDSQSSQDASQDIQTSQGSVSSQDETTTAPETPDEASAPSTEPPDDLGAESTEDTPTTASANEADTPNADEAEAATLPIDLEERLEEELSRRAEQLRQDFEARKKQLETELEEARRQEEAAASGEDGSTPPPPDGEGGGGV